MGTLSCPWQLHKVGWPALNWMVRHLPKATGLHRNTIRNIEVVCYAGNQDSIALVESVFQEASVQFLPKHGMRSHELRDTGREGG